MKRFLAATLLMLLGVTAAYAYNASRRERKYRELVDQGEAALARDDTRTAVVAFSGAIAFKGDSMLGYLKRGETYRRRNELEPALSDLRRAAEIDPVAPRPLELLGDVTYALGRFARAAEHYQASVKLDDRSARVLYKLGLARYSGGDPEAGLRALRQAAALEDLPEVAYVMGLCLRDLQKPIAALEALSHAVKLAPGLLRAQEELGTLYGALGRQNDRIAQLELLRVLDPGPAREVALGLAYARAGLTDRAIMTLGGAAERFSPSPDPYVALGRVWLDKAQSTHDRVDLNKALEALEAAVSNDDTAEALALYGRALLLAGENEGAERVLQRATTKLPVDPPAFIDLADAAERDGHFDTARRALLDFQALQGEEHDPRRSSSMAVRLGDLSFRSGRAAEAVAWYHRGVGPDADAPLLVRFAEAQLAAGDQPGARATVARALERDPTDRAARGLQRRLQ